MTESLESSRDCELHGVVLKLRKASRRLAFVTLKPLATRDGEGDREVQVMFEGDHDTDWRSACFPEGDGKRVCCGSTITAACVPDDQKEADHTDRGNECTTVTGNDPARVKIPCYRALRASVAFSPHDAMTESGAVRQHPAVERIAACHREPAHRRAGAKDDHRAPERASKKSVPPLCRQWWRGKCEKNQEDERQDWTSTSKKCWRRHFFLDGEEQERFERLRDKAARMQAEEEVVVADDPHSQESKASRSKSDSIFVDWLLSTFGSHALRQGSGVVDIAGGKGSVSFELVSTHGIPATLIDPRPLRLSKSQQRLLTKRRAAASSQAGDGGDWQAVLLAGGGFEPVSDCGGGGGDGAEKDVGGGGNSVERATEAEKIQDTAGGGERGSREGGVVDGEAEGREGMGKAEAEAEAEAEGSGEEKRGLVHLRGVVETETAGEGAVGSALRTCSLLIGMHPDQATEAIIAAALRFGKPFAVPAQSLNLPNPHFTLLDPTPHLHFPLWNPAALAPTTSPFSMWFEIVFTEDPLFTFAAWLRGHSGWSSTSQSLTRVVPCCVFPSEFPHRQTPGGRPVVKYSEFIDYLCSLDAGIQQTYLPFKGRNKVLFHMGLASATGAGEPGADAAQQGGER